MKTKIFAGVMIGLSLALSVTSMAWSRKSHESQQYDNRLDSHDYQFRVQDMRFKTHDSQIRDLQYRCDRAEDRLNGKTEPPKRIADRLDEDTSYEP